MKTIGKPECKHKCRFLQITDGLWLCPHAAYGPATSRKGAIEEGRQVLAAAGGYDQVLSRVLAEEQERREIAAERREHQHEALRNSLKYHG